MKRTRYFVSGASARCSRLAQKWRPHARRQCHHDGSPRMKSRVPESSTAIRACTGFTNPAGALPPLTLAASRVVTQAAAPRPC